MSRFNRQQWATAVGVTGVQEQRGRTAWAIIYLQVARPTRRPLHPLRRLRRQALFNISHPQLSFLILLLIAESGTLTSVARALTASFDRYIPRDRKHLMAAKL